MTTSEYNSVHPRDVFSVSERSVGERYQPAGINRNLRGIGEASKMSYGVLDDANPIESRAASDALNSSPQEPTLEEMRTGLRHGRKLEDVEYWRQRAGWADDDATMQQFNQGVYDAYYAIDSSAASETETSTSKSGGNSGIIITLAKVVGGILGVALLFLLIRAVRRRVSGTSSGSKKSRSATTTSGSASRSSSRRRSSSRARGSSSTRSRSKSVGRSRSSRSRSRSRRAKSSSDDNYALMEDDQRSRKSGRSRSRSVKRSSSRSRSKKRESSSGQQENMLV